nr:PDDEXK nuclease domain-containing protein [Mariprofundus erugo]
MTNYYFREPGGNYGYSCFPIWDAASHKLSWTHYRNLTHQDVGQMDSYVRIYDQHHRPEGDHPTIGLILCSQKSEAVVKYSVLTDSEQLFAAKYLPYLPTEAELKYELEPDRLRLQAQFIESATKS